jgi:hypothetical protein
MDHLSEASWRRVREENPRVLDLLREHYEEIALHQDAIPLDPDWGRYDALEAAGNLVAYIARDDAGEVVGYALFFVNYHIHYNRTLVAQNDVLFLRKDRRKGTTTGIRLIRFAVEQLTARGVDRIQWHIKTDHDFSPILERMGFVVEEKILGKMIRRKAWE